MVDKNSIKRIIDNRKKAHVNDPDIENKYWIPLVEALGDNEDDIIKYLNELNDEDAAWFSEIYEEVTEKFPSSQMETAFERINKL